MFLLQLFPAPQTMSQGVGERVSSMWTSTQKIRALWHHPVFFSCKEVCGLFQVNGMSTSGGGVRLRWT